jgi:hypothetical protein
MNTTNFLLILLGSCLILCFILMLINNTDNTYTTKYKNNSIEGFAPTVSNTNQDPVLNAIQSQLEIESPEALQSTVKALQQRLIDYGYAPDLNKFVKKTELGPNDGKCLVNKAEDRDKYISKSDVPPPGPRIDLSQYVKKSSIPPEKICPPPPEIDYSAYVKKSTLPPNEKCAPCIAPKVKVSAGLCRECPPAPSCPPPERCPEKKCPEPVPCPAEKKCPQPAPCPAEKKCPQPAPCPTIRKCKSCDEIRYIKVPAVITKTVMVDQNGNIISQKVDSGNTNPTMSNTPSAEQIYRKERKEWEESELRQYKDDIKKYKEELKIYKENSNINTNTTEASLMSAMLAMPTMPTMPTMPSTTQSNSIFNTMFGISDNNQPTTTFSQNQIPTTTLPQIQSTNTTFSQNQIPTTTFPQIHTCNSNSNKQFGSKKSFCSACELNSEFKSYGIYGPP